MTAANSPSYLQPYLAAAKKYGAGFGTLLWASPMTQAARFDALLRAVDCTGKTVLDVGCGRADLLQQMFRRHVIPMKYIGLEAVDELSSAAEAKQLPNCRIIRGDFIRDPELLDVNADVILFSGSLNTCNDSSFYTAITLAFAATKNVLAFNFLSSPFLAASSYLTWHKPEAVLAFCKTMSDQVTVWEKYLKGDTTIAIRKESDGQ